MGLKGNARFPFYVLSTKFQRKKMDLFLFTFPANQFNFL